MTRSDKAVLIDELKAKFVDNQYFYFADSSALTVEQINQLRGLCFEKGIEIKVIKNTLAKKALEVNEAEKGFEPLYEALSGPTTVFFADTANAPAKVIKEFRKSFDKPYRRSYRLTTVSCEECNKCSKIKWRNHSWYPKDTRGKRIRLLTSIWLPSFVTRYNYLFKNFKTITTWQI